MQNITPCLWFDRNAEEAAKFYVSIFKNAKITATSHYGDGMPLPKGTVLTVIFELNGQKFMGLNGGPLYKFTEAVSFSIDCETQQEIDHYWNRLTEGGEPGQCGWLKDKFGVSWQVVPSNMGSLMQNKDAAKSQRVMKALLGMKKLVIKELEEA